MSAVDKSSSYERFLHKRNVLASKLLLLRLQRASKAGDAARMPRDPVLFSAYGGNGQSGRLVHQVKVREQRKKINRPVCAKRIKFDLNEKCKPEFVIMQIDDRSRVGVPLTIGHIMDEVCRVFSVDAESLMTESREHTYTVPRHVIIMLALELLGCSLSTVGRAFRKDHTTMLNSRRRAMLHCSRNAEFAALVDRIRTTLKIKYQVAGEVLQAAE